MNSNKRLILFLGICLVTLTIGASNCAGGRNQTLTVTPGSSPSPSPVVLPTLSSAAGTALASLPEPIQWAHRSFLFHVTWADLPSTPGGWSDILSLGPDGRMWRSIIATTYIGSPEPDIAQLTAEEMAEVRVILEGMPEESTVGQIDQSVGATVVILSLMGKGARRSFTFGGAHCPEGVRRLFEVADVAFTRAYPTWDVLESPCHPIQIPPDSTPVPLVVPAIAMASHKQVILFHVTWFEQPFTGAYRELYSWRDSSDAESVTCCNQRTAPNENEQGPLGVLTDEERQEVDESRESLVRLNPVEQPAGDTIITLSIPWQIDTHIFNFGTSNCPPELRRLFAIADAAFKRQSPEYEGCENPCQ